MGEMHKSHCVQYLICLGPRKAIKLALHEFADLLKTVYTFYFDI